MPFVESVDLYTHLMHKIALVAIQPNSYYSKQPKPKQSDISCRNQSS
jgi:hypothetical protein